eukprot:CAMPEP_0169484330 /NCGR_PEP_ID=MMETSP1042-20121227/31696_1 /TAXON_ID=464988 /ORGANISM="Hemiselmis andersenii, Strain CCMP1180" /LENGTH=149 /DNA_ID=CAMNT_0009599347 /DNA_START=435 /DNA_END=881 /DNA_ORIENTATION=+
MDGSFGPVFGPCNCSGGFYGDPTAGCLRCQTFAFSLPGSRSAADCRCVYPYNDFEGECFIENWAWVDLTAAEGGRPDARAGHAVATVGRHVYIFGGEFGFFGFKNDFYKLDLGVVPNQWTDLTTSSAHPVSGYAPGARQGHGMAAAGGR